MDVLPQATLGPHTPSTPASAKGESVDEKDLVQRLLARDEAAFREIVRRHHGSMIGVARLYVRDRATAEEVVQETWLALLDGLDGFEQRSSLKTWLFGILVNKAKTRAVREGRTVSLDGLSPGDEARRHDFRDDGGWARPPEQWHGLTPERIVAGRQILEHVREFIDELAPSQRAVIILRDIEGQDASVTCRMLGLTEANQRVLLHRARASVRNRLAQLIEPSKAADTSAG